MYQGLWRPYRPYLLLPMRLNTNGSRVRLVVLTICLSSTSFAHSNHNQVHFNNSSPLTGPTWVEKYGPQIDQTFSGPLSFSHLPYVRCLQEESTDFDIAVLGLPFDTGVSYRPGQIFHLTRVWICSQHTFSTSLQRSIWTLRYPIWKSAAERFERVLPQLGKQPLHVRSKDHRLWRRKFQCLTRGITND